MGYQTIYGRGYRLNIKTKQKVSCPQKGTEEREKLEEVIKEMDKWNDVSTLDIHALGEVVLEESWKPEMIKNVKKHVKIETTSSVTLSKSDNQEK